MAHALSGVPEIRVFRFGSDTTEDGLWDEHDRHNSNCHWYSCNVTAATLTAFVDQLVPSAGEKGTAWLSSGRGVALTEGFQVRLNVPRLAPCSLLIRPGDRCFPRIPGQVAPSRAAFASGRKERKLRPGLDQGHIVCLAPAHACTPAQDVRLFEAGTGFAASKIMHANGWHGLLNFRAGADSIHVAMSSTSDATDAGSATAAAGAGGGMQGEETSAVVREAADSDSFDDEEDDKSGGVNVGDVVRCP
jgi:hypothetical protein